VQTTFTLPLGVVITFPVPSRTWSPVERKQTNSSMVAPWPSSLLAPNAEGTDNAIVAVLVAASRASRRFRIRFLPDRRFTYSESLPVSSPAEPTNRLNDQVSTKAGELQDRVRLHVDLTILAKLACAQPGALSSARR